jgi:hypothetical protein
MKYAGADWVEYNALEPISPIGRQVADILGQVFRGIYHIDKDIRRADLTKDYVAMTISASRDFSTFDTSLLTELVVLCHDACIRLEIQTAGPRYFRLLFHQRKREGQMYERMPTMEEHIKMIRENIGGEE